MFNLYWLIMRKFLLSQSDGAFIENWRCGVIGCHLHKHTHTHSKTKCKRERSTGGKRDGAIRGMLTIKTANKMPNVTQTPQAPCEKMGKNTTICIFICMFYLVSNGGNFFF